MKPLLELDHISYSYHSLIGETKALENISFSVENGEFIAIVGPSGCGKSTLLSIISGLILPEEGVVRINGTENNATHTNIGYMLQKDQLFEWRTIYSNVTLGLEIQHKMTSPYKENVDKMLETYGLSNFVHARPSELSGGMRQRAALIRTLALEPDLLLLDEPFSALDYQTRLEVCDDIATIIKREKKTAILVTHDLSEAISVGNRVIILSRRPATIQKIVPISFSIPDCTPMNSRNTPEFAEYFNTIWKELSYHG